MVSLLMATLAALLVGADSNYPVFEAANNMKNLLLPSDTRIGTIIYRLRATDPDRDYPLVFAATDYGSYVIRIETLPCLSNSSSCQANVFLERSVAPGQLYKFRMTVRDSTGDTTTIAVTIEVTSGSSDVNIVFPHIPGVIMVPEDTKVGTELEYVIVRKNPRRSRPASLELWKEVNGSYLHSAAEFRLVQSSVKERTTGLIKLAQELDYELQTMYRLTIYALDMYVVPTEDSRNIAGFQLVVVVSDVQDTPPVWDHIDPITVLPINLTEGDLVLKVTARDGDTGAPRQIKYGLVSEGNPFTVFFSIGRDNGEIRLVRPLRELTSISYSHQPVLLTVMAEEVVSPGDPVPAMASEAKVALLLGELGNTAPYFQSSHYVAMIEENSAQGTVLQFDSVYNTMVQDDNMGKQGVFALSLENNNGTFEVSPSIAERRAAFTIRVRDSSMLDYETNKVLTFKLVAQEVAPGKKALFSSVNVTVYITDVNDNTPVFSVPQYVASMPENVTVGHQVVSVTAHDPDTGLGGLVRYTALLGYLNTSLSLHPQSGIITVSIPNHGFDREQASEYRFLVEARDNDGVGNVATAPLIIKLTDVNDEAPRFLRDPMDFVLKQDGLEFTERAFIKAIDLDAEPPNNIVRYEIVSGNYEGRFSIQGETGELRVTMSTSYSRKEPSTMSILTVRAYDMGVPTQWSVAQVRVYPYSSGARILTFIVPGSPDKGEVQRLLEQVTGGQVTVQEVTPYHNYQGPAQDLTNGSQDPHKSVVVATVMYTTSAGGTVLGTGQPIKDVDKGSHQHFNRTELTAAVGEYRTENQLLFWLLLLILLLIALALITLLCCCLCPCCPLYTTTRKRSRIHTAENVHLVVKEDDHGHESKAVQAEWNGTDRKEAWSSDTYTRSSWQFNRRNTHNVEPQRVVLMARGGEELGKHHQPAPQSHHQPVSVIYTRDMARRQDHVILEDIDGTEYRVLDPSRLSLPVRVEEDPEAASIRRHEIDRGSDGGRGRREESTAGPELQPRDQMFIRDGNAEILRLVTRGRVEEEEPRLNQPDTRPYTVVEGVENVEKQQEDGKGIIMQRFIEDQKKSTEDNESMKKSTQEENQNAAKVNGTTNESKSNSRNDRLLHSLMDIPQRNLSTGEVNRLTTLQRDLLLTRFLVEEQRRTFASIPIHDDTQSLPGVVPSMATMATQTDVNRGTQTETLYTMRPPRRKAKSDLDDSGESDTETSIDFHGKLIKKYKKNRKMISQIDFPERGRSLSRCEIKTPILEESESAMENFGNLYQSHYSKGVASQSGFAATKSSMLRSQMTRKRLQEEAQLEEQPTSILKFSNPVKSSDKSSVGLKTKSKSEHNLPLATTASRSVNRNIESKKGTKSLHGSPVPIRKDFNNQHRNKNILDEIGSDDDVSEEELLEGIYNRSKSSLNTRNASTSPIQTYSKRKSSSSERISSRSDSQRESPDKNNGRSSGNNTHFNRTQGQSRYMEWYKSKREEREKQKAEEKEVERRRIMKPVKPVMQRISRRDTPTKSSRIEQLISRKTPDLKTAQSQVVKKQNAVKQNVINVVQSTKIDTDKQKKHVILQDLKKDNKQRGLEDDQDSGIAIPPGSQKLERKNQHLLEKKSVFTIAYGDMQTKQLRIDSASPPENR